MHGVMTWPVTLSRDSLLPPFSHVSLHLSPNTAGSVTCQFSLASLPTLPLMALPPPPAGLDLTESQVPAINGTLISMLVLATVAILLRLYARYLKGNPVVSRFQCKKKYFKSE